MPWTAPKTDWAISDGVSEADLNRIENNTLQLKTDLDTNVIATATAQAKADAAVPSTSYNANDVVAKVKSVAVATAAIDVDKLDGKHAAATLLTTEKNDLAGAINELFTSASNGKVLIANAINGKGGSASGTDPYATLASKITAIPLATGNAVAGDVLAGKTFSTPAGTGITGTMVDRGAMAITPSALGNVTIPGGKHSGSGYVAQVSVNTAALLSGYAVAGAAGTMPDRGAAVFTPSALGNVGMPAGYYNGGGYVAQVSVNTGALLTGYSVAGANGAMPNNGAPTWNPTTFNQGLSAGYYSGGLILGSGNLTPPNILAGVDIFGVVGNAAGLKRIGGTISGLTYSSNMPTSVACNFRPYLVRVVMVRTDTNFLVAGGTMSPYNDDAFPGGSRPWMSSKALEGSYNTSGPNASWDGSTLFMSIGNSYSTSTFYHVIWHAVGY